MLASDGSMSFVLFLYENIQWTEWPVNIGFNAGDGTGAYNMPGALTAAVQDVDDGSNIGVKGVYIFCVDEPIVKHPYDGKK